MKKFINFRGFVSLLTAFSFLFAFISGIILSLFYTAGKNCLLDKLEVFRAHKDRLDKYAYYFLHYFHAYSIFPSLL